MANFVLVSQDKLINFDTVKKVSKDPVNFIVVTYKDGGYEEINFDNGKIRDETFKLIVLQASDNKIKFED